jgi:hypothetical protein
MKNSIYLLCLICCGPLWSLDKGDFNQNRHHFKLTVLDLSGLYLKTIKLGYEFNPRHKRAALELEWGYTHYSREDAAYTRGYFYSFSGNYDLISKNGIRLTFKLKPFYHKLYMDHYLKYYEITNGFGDYYDYRKTKYTKERYGAYVAAGLQHYIYKDFFAEYDIGVGGMKFKTEVPDGVDQNFYRNGLFNRKEYVSPTVMINIKLGYAF